ncbi:N-acetylmuramoyl-L-alanine amidase [Micromonospora gifhornensis]|uniref:peptidoglycan recognition protein family protein n=1 Tax=Micromonospora gifhornensis TaxID=84594 RepID=UPI0034563AD5
MRLLWLPEVLRAAGLTVHEYDGWRTRGSDQWGPIRGITCHATAGSATSTDAGELRVLVTGSTSAPPPIAQLYLSRSGQWWVVASGRCNHNLVGWAGPNKDLGNSALLGIEAQNDNRGQAWPQAQYESYVRGVAALVERLGIPVGRVAGHKEHQPAGYGKSSTKSDPTFDMAKFRRDVAAMVAGTGSSTGGMDDMFVKRGDKGQGVRYLQRRIERLGILVDKKPITVDGDYGPATQAFVRAAELAWNKDFKGDGSEVTAETWTRLDDLYLRQEVAKLAPKPPLPPAPVIDYRQLALAAVGLAAEQRTSKQG